MYRGGGGFVRSQIRGGKFRCGKSRGAPWIECITPPPPRPESTVCIAECEKFAENPEQRVGNFAVNLKCEISHAKLKCHETLCVAFCLVVVFLRGPGQSHVLPFA